MNKYAEHSKQGQARHALYGRIHKTGARACIRKVIHETEQEAQEFLDKNGYPGNPYRCQHCYRWHVTTKEVFSG